MKLKAWKPFGMFVVFAILLAISLRAKQRGNAGLQATPQGANGPAAAANSETPDQGNAARGRLIFLQNCAFCHGSDAHGGEGGGPDLTLSGIAMGRPGNPPLAEFLKTGLPPRMPSFGNLTDQQIADIQAFVRSQAIGGGRGPRVVAVVGNANAGKEFFYGAGKCSMCHSVTGDLKGIGSKYDVETLQGWLVLPRGKGGYPGLPFGGTSSTPPHAPLKVTVTEPDGQVTSGSLVFVSDFDVTLREKDGVTRTFARNGGVPKVVITDPLQAHLDLLPKLTNEEMHDLTAYLETLK